jgi:zinc/manganese transport system permease protein
MIDFLSLMLKPFVACMILVAIHVYLGMHVVRRGIIFVDLALAQVSALGATLGFLFGFGLESTESYLFAVGFTVLGAAIFALTRSRDPVVPQEALIGIVYAVSASAAILVLSRAPEGGEELKAIMVGNLLFVDWPEILKVLVLYSAISATHFLARSRLLLISEDPQEAYARGMHVHLWDFFFYATFGVVVTSAVQIVGVLLVFALLIAPAICGTFLGRTVLSRLVIACAAGVLTCTAGIAASYFWDLPTGATIVCAFGVTLLACGALRAILGRSGGEGPPVHARIAPETGADHGSTLNSA